MQIVVLDSKSLRPEELDWSGLREQGTLSLYDRTDAILVSQRLRGADAVFTNKVCLTREQLSGNPNLKFIGVLATGYDVVDIKGARELGIPVCNVPGYATEPVAQTAIGLLLEDRNVAQVSMNMVNYEGTPLYYAYEMIRALADRWGVRIIGTELVGLTPAKALVDCAEYYLKLENFDCHKQVMEYHLVGME